MLPVLWQRGHSFIAGLLLTPPNVLGNENVCNELLSIFKFDYSHRLPGNKGLAFLSTMLYCLVWLAVVVSGLGNCACPRGKTAQRGRIPRDDLTGKVGAKRWL